MPLRAASAKASSGSRVPSRCRCSSAVGRSGTSGFAGCTTRDRSRCCDAEGCPVDRSPDTDVEKRMQMLVAGIAWTDRGFEVALADESGQPAGPLVRFPAGQVGALTEHLRSLDGSAGQPLICVVESTDGMVDGGLMSAGLRVHRADPWTLPDRPAFGSVDAATLARTGATRLAELPRLVLEEGSLTGRSADHAAGLEASEPALAALTDAGRCLTHGTR